MYSNASPPPPPFAPAKPERNPFLAELYKLSVGRCEQCGWSIYEDLETDHIKRLADGGADDSTNMQVLCKSCHQTKTTFENLGYPPAPPPMGY